MKNTERDASSPLPTHVQLKRRGADSAAWTSTDDPSLWAGESPAHPIPHHTNCRLRFRLNRHHGHRRLDRLAATFAAVAATAATAYLLLRCFWHLGASKEPNSFLRSVAAVGEEGEGCGEPWLSGATGEPASAAVESEVLDEERVLKRAKAYTSDLAHMMRESRRALLLMPSSYSVKGFSNLLRLCVVELAALCSLLQQGERHCLVYAVDLIKFDTVFFRYFFGPKRASRASVRHIDRLHAFLRELPHMDFGGGSMSPSERFLKIVQLLTLQQIALTQIQDRMQLLAACCQDEACAAAVHMDALHKLTETRRNQVFQDTVLSRWLRGKHSERSHFGIAAPSIIQAIIAIPPKPHEEHLKELLNIPLGVKQQESIPQDMGEDDVPPDGQAQQDPLLTEAYARGAETAPNPPKNPSCSEASVKRGEEADVGAIVDQRPETSCTSNIPAVGGSLGLAGTVGDSAVGASGGEAYNNSLNPVYGPSVSLQVARGPDTPWVSGSHRVRKAFTSSEASAKMEMSLPPNYSEEFPPLPSSRWPLTSVYAKMSDTVKASQPAVTAERFRPSLPTSAQASTHLRGDETATILESAKEEKLLKGAWRVQAAEDSLACQKTQTPLGIGLQTWRDGPTVAPTEWGSGGQGGVTKPAKQGLLDPHALGSPLSQLTLSLPGQSSGGFSEMQPNAEPSASAQGLAGVPGFSSIWRFDGSTSDQAALQRLPSGFGKPAPSSIASAGWRVRRMEVGPLLQQPEEEEAAECETACIPFKGVALGEPAGGIKEQEAGSAAHVAAVLFSPTSADFSKSLFSLEAPSGGSAGK
ncbi:hypothetical protein EPH_0007040 [Eimeria praecox]|uniref:Uncharacterized protein n=1 Tax=Eimeria praecox TaxID=51316 RepID=U6GA90_9EIME|nr:hypothetical protein EPH_0007040 [Eimeria praecox]